MEQAAERDALERSHARRVAGHRQVDVWRVWKAKGIKPRLSRTFKVGNDPAFVDKMVDAVGFYLGPRSRSWCCALTKRASFRRWIARNRACR